MYDYVIILSAYVRGKYRVCTYDLITSVILTKPPTVLSFSHLVVLVVQVLYKKWARAERPNDQVIKWALNCIPPFGDHAVSSRLEARALINIHTRLVCL